MRVLNILTDRYDTAAANLADAIDRERRDEEAVQSILERIEALKAHHAANPNKENFDNLVKAQDKLRYVREDQQELRRERVPVEQYRAELRYWEILLEAHINAVSLGTLEAYISSK